MCAYRRSEHIELFMHAVMRAYRRSEHIELFVFASPQKVHVMHAYLLVMRAYRRRESTSCYSYMPLRRGCRQGPLRRLNGECVQLVDSCP